MRRVPQPFRLACGLITAGLAGALVLPATAGERTFRAVVADHASGKITVIDAAAGRSIAHFGTEGPARLKLAPAGRIVTLTQGAQGHVQFLDTGVALSGHGDHTDAHIAAAPRLLAGRVAGKKPSHVNFDAAKIAVFFDGDGIARVGRMDKTSAGTSKLLEVRTARPHHGLAKPVRWGLAASLPHPTDEKALPVGIDVSAGGASLARSTDCPDLHGEGESGGMIGFGCSDGLLLLKISGGKPVFEKLAYPPHLPQGGKIRSIEGAREIKAMLADFRPDAMVIFDPVSQMFTHVPLPARRMAFTIEREAGAAGFVITEDGTVHRIDVLGGKIERSANVTGRYSLEGGSSVPRPRLAASGAMLAVTDPAKEQVHILSAVTLQRLTSVDVPGAPFDVVITGGQAHD